MNELKRYKPHEIDWRIMDALYEGHYNGPEINGIFGNAIVRANRLMWNGRQSDGLIDSWLQEWASPERLFEFTYEGAEGGCYAGYYDEQGFHRWLGAPMTAGEISAIDKATIKYCARGDD